MVNNISKVTVVLGCDASLNLWRMFEQAYLEVSGKRKLGAFITLKKGF